MDERLRAILRGMFTARAPGSPLPIVDPADWLAAEADPLARVSAAFLALACGAKHPEYGRAEEMLATPDLGVAELAGFYSDGLVRIAAEVDAVVAADPAFGDDLASSAERLASAPDRAAANEAMWHAFFPEAEGIEGHEEERIAGLRAARTVDVTGPVSDPIVDPANEVLFTSNVLLTVPASDTDLAALPYPAPLRAAIAAVAGEEQRYWFDHPIQVGCEPASNELLYGLRGLDTAVAAEDGDQRITCLLSVSVTHHGLGGMTRAYVEAELERAGGLQHTDVVAVTEDDAQRLVDEVLVPALAVHVGADVAAAAAAGLRAIFGVDGEYGRHYSFLKAIGALWHVVVDRRVRATFKIDLDQVFPQPVLRQETGRTMFEHLTTPLWGALGVDSEGRDIELGMLAGALVNERDIDQGLFTPDVSFPESAPSFDEHVFYSQLPQAVSTRAEMMARYGGIDLDGVGRALERVHVTGGTNGIRVDALRRYRPFTPSFIGRAEDQAYIISTLGRSGRRLAYVHAAGLIMRHDKEAFAGDAMAAARVGKLIGDDIRILLFSAYAQAAAGDDRGGALDGRAIRRLLDPFTGAFVSMIPQTVVLLRLALRTLRLFDAGDDAEAREYAIDGSRRLSEALAPKGAVDAMTMHVAEERAAWGHYYDAIDALEAGIRAADERYLDLAERARRILDGCRIASARST